MIFLHNLIAVAVSAVMLMLGWFLVGGFLGVRYPFGEFLFSAPIGRLALGLGFIVVTALYWITAVPRRARKDQFLSFESEGGTVSVSVRAVNDFLTKLAREFAGIVSLRSDVIGSRRGAVEIRLELTVKAGAKIQELSELLQQRVRESMRDSMGISDVASVKVSVTEIVAASEKENGRVDRDEWQNTTM